MKIDNLMRSHVRRPRTYDTMTMMKIYKKNVRLPVHVSVALVDADPHLLVALQTYSPESLA